MKYGAIIAVFASAVAARYMYARLLQRLHSLSTNI